MRLRRLLVLDIFTLVLALSHGLVLVLNFLFIPNFLRDDSFCMLASEAESFCSVGVHVPPSV